MREIGRETGSHLYADMLGMTFAGSQAEFAQILLAEAWINSHRDQKETPKPIELPKPFLPEVPVKATDAEVETAKAVLAANSMFGDR